MSKNLVKAKTKFYNFQVWYNVAYSIIIILFIQYPLITWTVGLPGVPRNLSDNIIVPLNNSGCCYDIPLSWDNPHNDQSVNLLGVIDHFEVNYRDSPNEITRTNVWNKTIMVCLSTCATQQVSITAVDKCGLKSLPIHVELSCEGLYKEACKTYLLLLVFLLLLSQH